MVADYSPAPSLRPRWYREGTQAQWPCAQSPKQGLSCEHIARYACMHANVFRNKCTHAHTHTHTHARTHARTHIYTHTQGDPRTGEATTVGEAVVTNSGGRRDRSRPSGRPALSLGGPPLSHPRICICQSLKYWREECTHVVGKKWASKNDGFV
jgi:hypothetical protein